MAFPQVAGTNTSSHGSGVTSHTVSLPASIGAGDLLLIFANFNGSTVAVSVPTGWTEIYDSQSGSGSAWGWKAYRIADGGEGTSVSVTTDVSVTSAHQTFRITGHGGNAPELSSAGGTSSNPDPPSLTPSWGSADTLWFAVYSHDSTTSISAYPTNYTNGNHTATASGVASARRELAATSEDPGTFTVTTLRDADVITLAVEPAAAGGPTTAPWYYRAQQAVAA